MRSKLFHLGLTLVAMLVLSASAYGCSCLGGETICQSFGSASAVFVGIPTAVTTGPETREEDKGRMRRIFKFTVEQSFLGVNGTELEVKTGFDGGDCGYDFVIGQRYLVYAYRSRAKDRFSTGICSRTTPYEQADEDIKYLDSLRPLAPGVTIYGEVKGRESSAKDGDAGAKFGTADFALGIEGEGETREVRTDEQGRYRVTGLSPGKYEVKVLRPEELTIYGPKREVTVADRGCAILNFYVVENGRVSGRALDPEGRPVANLLIGIVDVDEEDVGRIYNKFERTDQEGRYSFSAIPPGRYLVGVNTTKYTQAKDATNAFPRTYYPGVADAAQATLIDVGAGEKVTDRDLRLLPRRLARAIHVRVVGTDRQPVANARIRFSDATYYDSGSITSATADEHGQFTIDAYEGQVLAIEARSGEAYVPTSGFAFPEFVAPIRITVGSQPEQFETVVIKVR